jgi:hypothetical protein
VFAPLAGELGSVAGGGEGGDGRLLAGMSDIWASCRHKTERSCNGLNSELQCRCRPSTPQRGKASVGWDQALLIKLQAHLRQIRCKMLSLARGKTRVRHTSCNARKSAFDAFKNIDWSVAESGRICPRLPFASSIFPGADAKAWSAAVLTRTSPFLLLVKVQLSKSREPACATSAAVLLLLANKQSLKEQRAPSA